MKYVSMKVFDCQDMPDCARKELFEQFEQANDCAVIYSVGEREVIYTFDIWLLENGAKYGEKVVIKYWW